MSLSTTLILITLIVPQDAERLERQETPGAQTETLQRVAPKTWDYLLPSDRWRPLISPLVLDGVEFAVRLEDPSSLHLDTDADGKLEKRVTSPHARVRLQAIDGVAHLLRIRRAGEAWEWSNGEILTGRVEGVRLQIIDLDGDGRFDGYGRDAMVLGEKAGASYLSRVASISDRLFHLTLSASVENVSTRPYSGPTAHLDVRRGFQSRGELDYAVFSSGESSFELADAPEGRRIPAGSYRFISGRVSKGAETARMAGGSMAPIVLAAEQSHSLTWGGPLHARFRCSVSDGELTVFSNVRFTGVGGEEYFGFAPDANSPSIRVLDARTGKVVLYGQMGGCCGGGFSAYVARVPSKVPLEVHLDHKRTLFESIRGRVRPSHVAIADKAPR
jgi:hypothetical protein